MPSRASRADSSGSVAFCRNHPLLPALMARDPALRLQKLSPVAVDRIEPHRRLVASILARGLRFFLVAGLLWKFGPPIRDFIERYLPQLTILFFVLLFGGFLAVRYLF